ncbi:MAG: SRPBCC family protein [Acidimicrobiia bacterium]|nr:SRPBCC family protein [Acidimicrobiia bacterium]
MTVVTVSDTFDAPIDRVWPMVSDFGGIEKYMRGIDSLSTEGSGLGMDRIIGMGEGAVVERLTWLDDAAHSYSYTIVSGDGLPFDRYVATVKLAANGDRTDIVWEGNFAPKSGQEEAAPKLARAIYTGGIKGYKAALG